MRTLVLNSNTVVQDGLNNKLIFKFPNSAKFDKAYVVVERDANDGRVPDPVAPGNIIG